MQAQQDHRGGGGQPAGGYPEEHLPLTCMTKKGRRFLVVDDMLARLGSPLSIKRGDAPPYWDSLCAGDDGETEARMEEVPGGGGLEVEWLVSAEMAMLIAFLEREAGRASAERALGVSRGICRAFPECDDLESVDLRMIAESSGLLEEGGDGEAEDGCRVGLYLLDKADAEGGQGQDAVVACEAGSSWRAAALSGSAKDVRIAEACSNDKEEDSCDEEAEAEAEAEAEVVGGWGGGGEKEEEDEDHEDESMVFVVRSKTDGKKCVHMARLFKIVSKRKWRGITTLPYLQSLREHNSCIFKDDCYGCSAGMSWLASPEAALVCIHLELKANRSSKAAVKRLRGEIFEAFRGRGLESLDVEQLARDLGVGAGNASSDSDTSTSSEDAGEEEGEDRAYGNGGSSSSSAFQSQNRKTTRDTGASSGSFIVVAQHKGKAFVHLRRLLAQIGKVRTESQIKHYISRTCTYLQCLREYEAHMFKDARKGQGIITWFVSPEAALLVCHFELKAEMTSKDLAKQARAEVLRAFPEKRLEGLDLEKLARKLGVVDARVAAPQRRDAAQPPSSKITCKTDKGSKNEAASHEFNGKSSVCKRKRGDDCDVEEGLDASSGERSRQENSAFGATRSSSASSSSEDEGGEDHDYGNGGSSSSIAVPSQKCAPARGTGASSGSVHSFVVKAKRKGVNFIHVSRLLERMDKSGKTQKQIAHYIKMKSCYLQCLKRHEAHMFKDGGEGHCSRTWFVSPEAALLIICFERKAEMASVDRAKRARAEVLRAFPGKGLEGLDLEELARKLGVVDERVAAPERDAVQPSSAQSSKKTDKDRMREALRRDFKRKACASKRKRDSDGHDEECNDSVSDVGARPAVAALKSEKKAKAAVDSDDSDSGIDEALVTIKEKAKGRSSTTSHPAQGFIDESGEDEIARLRWEIERERLREELAGIKNRSAQSMRNVATAERETARAMSETYEEQLRLERLKAERQKAPCASSKHSMT